MLNVIKQQHKEDVCDNAVAIIWGADEPNSLKSEIEAVASFHNLDCNSFFSREFYVKFKQLLKDEEPDVVHAWSYDSGLVAGFIARFMHRTKVVWGIHSLGIPSRHQYTALRYGILKTMVGIGSRLIPHRIISCTKPATDAHVKFGYPRKRCVNIANGIDVNRFNIDSAIAVSVRQDLGIDATAPIVGYIGRSHPVKCIEGYFDAASILMRKRPDVHFVVIGFSVDSLYVKARDAYDKLPDPSRMHILGNCEDPSKTIPAFTINALSSKSEALPMSLMEAMSCGVPCVTTNVGSAAEVVGEAGKCVSPDDAQALSVAMDDLLDEVLLDPIPWSQKAREHCLNYYNIVDTEKKHTQVYSELSGVEADNRSVSPRVLHLVNSVGLGGAEELLKRLTIALKKDGFDQIVVPIIPGGSLTPEFEKAGIPVKTLDVRGPFSAVRGLFRLAGMIRREKPDLIQTWMYHSALIGEIAAILSLRFPKTLWSIHHTKLGKESSKFTTRVTHRILAMLSARMPERIIYCSKSSVDLHLESKFSDTKTQLIFNGTDTTVYQPSFEAKKKFRNEFDIPIDAPLIGMVGRYHPQKDFANLLRAFAIVQETIPNAHLVGCGRNVDRKEDALRELADACPYPSQVHLIGPRMDMPQVYPAFTMSALSSCEGEAFPLVLGEAMSCEVPCVSTDVGDSGLILGDVGYLVPPRNTEDLAAAMTKMLSLPKDELEALGVASRKRVEENFTLRTYSQAHARLYRSLLPSCHAEMKVHDAIESPQLLTSKL